MTSASCSAPHLFLHPCRAHLSSMPALTATASPRTTCVTSSTTVETTLMRTPTSAVRPCQIKTCDFIWIIRSSWRFCAGVEQRASAGAATSSLTCAPGASANKMTSIGWSRQVAPWQWGPGLRGTTPWGTPLDTMSTWRAHSLKRPEMLPPSQDPSWAAGAPSVR